MYCEDCSIDVPVDTGACPSCGRPSSKAPGDRPLAKESTQGSGGLTMREPVLVTKTSARRGLRFPTGTLLAGRYRVVDLVGRGGMGEVYRVDDLKLGQKVALKLLPEVMEQDSEALDLFLNEVRLARQISHPNVCRVHDVGETEDRHFLTMEYIDGENLLTSLRRLGRPPKARASELAQQICLGLEAAHRQGILHRDLKPANLMIDGKGQARITDFGVAGLVDRIPGPQIRLGTPAYMAPEQLAGEEVSVRSDLYALGLLLYELFTGHRAYKAKDLEELRLQRILPPRAPSELVEGLGAAVDRAILQCLERDPRDRPSSALRVAAALRGSDPLLDGAVLKTLVDCRFAPQEETSEEQAAWLTERFLAITRELLLEHDGEEIDHRADVRGVLLLVDRPVSAIRYVMALHRSLLALHEQEGLELGAQVGIHLGEVVEDDSALPEYQRPRWTVTGAALDTVSGLASLAKEGQSLLSRAVFDLARQNPATGFEEVRWLAHGSYEITGLFEPLEVFEVGIEGMAPLMAPPESALARRKLVQETITGWRPAPGLEMPQRPHWRLEGKLEEGGFGEVWLAAHEKTRQRRVFKFCYEPWSLRSLQREITLFRLLKEELGDRADINRILDWNFDEAPYFIEAEYTEGGNLLNWAERHGGLEQIPLETRLEVLAQVATALAAAHSVGVLHKDVKPGNVLIAANAEGEARALLSDFGVGRITEQSRLEQAGITVLGLTEELQGVGADSFSGTRLYMAPELLVGKSATIQADIYALGVMLYQMVVGDFSQALAPGWERNVTDELLREDISVAVDGSLERRLSSASLLAERLRTLSERQQALASEHQERERVERAMVALKRSRQRRKVVGAAMVILLGFAAAMTFMWRKVAHEAEVTRQVSAFMVDLFKIPAPEESLGNKVTAREILDRGAEKIDLELEEQPEVQARLMLTMGQAYQSLGLFKAATPLLEKALAVQEVFHGENDLLTAQSLHAVADIQRLQGNYEEAESLIRRTLEIRQRSLPDDDEDLLKSLDLLARILQHRGVFENSENLFRETLDLRRKKLGPRHLDVAASLSSLGFLQMERMEFISAETYLREALEIKRELLEEEHPVVADAMSDLGVVLYHRSDFEGAEKILRYSLEVKKRVLGSRHPGINHELLFLAQIEKRNNNLEEADAFIREVIEINLKTKGAEHPHYAGALLYQAELYRAKGEDFKTKELYREALGIHRKSLGPDHLDVGGTLARLGYYYYQSGDYDEAEILVRDALQILEAVDSRILATALAYRYMALILDANGDFEGSELYFSKTLDLARNELDTEKVYVIMVLIEYGRSLARQKMCEESTRMTQEALNVLKVNQFPEDHWRVRYAEINLGICLGEAAKYEEAESLLLSSYLGLQGESVDSKYYSRQASREIIQLYERLGRREEADEYRGLM